MRPFKNSFQAPRALLSALLVSALAVSPAIANAIDDACGVRLTELPLSPESVLRALRAKDNKELEAQ